MTILTLMNATGEENGKKANSVNIKMLHSIKKPGFSEIISK